MSADKFAVTMKLQHGYQLLADFNLEGVDDLLLDEGEPLGEGAGPNPAQLLATAVVGCLSASLLFCLRKSHIEPAELTARIEGFKERNDKGRLRIGQLKVVLEPVVSPEEIDRVPRCMSLFQDFCTVTESVRQGLDVDVTVTPRAVVPAAS